MRCASVSRAKLVKRGELVDQADSAVETVKTGGHRTYKLTVNSFEAGTPFYIDVQAKGDGGNDTQGLLFVRKLD